MRKVYLIGLIGLAVLIIGIAWAEQITFSTYYPAPYGVYNQMVVRTLGVGDNDGDENIDSADAPDPTSQANDLWVAGNVGIGTVDPKSSLHVNDMNLATGSDLVLSRNWVADDNVRGSAIFHYYDVITRDILVFGVSGDKLGGGTNYTNPNTLGAAKMVIQPSGNVGIGETVPQARLHVGGTPGVDGIMFPDGTVQTTASGGGYDSGWFPVSKNSAYNKTHNLGTLPKTATVWFSTNSDGNNARLLGDIGLGAGTNWQGVSIRNVTTTTCQVVTGLSYLFSWYTGAGNEVIYNGYCRVILSP